MRRATHVAAIGAILACALAARAEPAAPEPIFHDAHFHLTDYVQHGPSIREHLVTMGQVVGRSTLFGIPLQQTWSWENSGEDAPTYYLHSDAPLYYYSFTDAMVAAAYLSLDEPGRARFDPMITGFNPSDMYAVDHIRRVLELYPGVFSGIGEFSIHKEFVSAKVAGDTASLSDPAVDRILDFAGEVGLVVILHNDIDVPFAKGAAPMHLDEMRALLARHADTTIIWAHTGLGRVVAPRHASAPAAERPATHLDLLSGILEDPRYDHVLFDLSWDEVAKYVVSSRDTTRRTAALLERHPSRFLFGTDAVAPSDQEAYTSVYELYRPLWQALDDETRSQVLRGNYERVFDGARARVRSWERAHVRTADAR